jgi:acetylornithine deacetylase/succinyl-diaminopimelate desuccinylase-like protein
LDVRTVPGQDVLQIRQELRQLLEAEGIPGEVALFMFRPGFEARQPEPLVEALGRAHESYFGRPLGPAAPVYSSMWRDHNVFNEVGIPAVTYGPGEGVAGGNLTMPIEQLYSAACVYALSALEVCLTPKE